MTTSVNVTRFDEFIHESPQTLRASIRSRKDGRHDSNRRAQFQRGDEIPQNLSGIFFGPVVKDKAKKIHISSDSEKLPYEDVLVSEG